MKVELPGLRRSFVNAFSVWLYRLGSILFALVSVPLITRRFGFEGLAVWLLVQQLASHAQLLELGLASSLGRVLSRDQASGDSAAYVAHATSAIVILLGASLLLMLVALPLGQYFPHLFDLSPALYTDAIAMLFIAVFSTGLTLPFRSAIGVLTSQHRFSLQARIDSLVLFIRLFLVVIVCSLELPHSLILLALAVFLPNLFGAMALFGIAAKLAPQKLFVASSIGINPVKELLDISLAAMVVTAAAVLLRQGSPVLTGLSLNAEAVPLIALPIMIVFSVSPFLGIASQLLSPIASQLDAESDRKSLMAIFFIAARYSLAAALLIFAAMYVLMPMLLPEWLGRDLVPTRHIQDIYTNILIIFAAYCITIPALLARSVLISVGRHRTAARGELTSALFGLCIGWVLLEYFNWGTTGMAIGIAGAYVFRAFGTIVYQLARYFDISVFQLYGTAVWRPLASAMPLAIGAKASSLAGHQWSLFLFAISFVVWLLTVWYIVLERDHRTRISRALKALRPAKRKI